MNISELIGRLQYLRDTMGVEDVFLNDDIDFCVDYEKEQGSHWVCIKEKAPPYVRTGKSE